MYSTVQSPTAWRERIRFVNHVVMTPPKDYKAVTMTRHGLAVAVVDGDGLFDFIS